MRTVDVAVPAGARSRHRRAQIALVAAELFCARGYHGVGIDEIAAAVGISGPAVYRHFPTKYAILVEATRDLVDATLAATRPAPGTPGDLDAVLAALAGLAVERRRAGALYQWERRYLTPGHRAEFGAGMSTLVGRLTRPLRRRRPDLPAASADSLARAALSVFGSIATHRAPVTRARAERTLVGAADAVLAADGVPGPRSVRPAPVEPARSRSRRETLLVEAVRLFRLHGYHAVGMEEIGRAAGITASSVYRHFPGKADLLAAACYRASERLTAVEGAALAGAAGPSDALDRLLAAYVGYAFEHSDLVTVYLTENGNLSERDRHDLRRTQRLHVEEWVRLLTSVRPGLPAVAARLLVHAAFTLVSDLGRSARFDPAAAAPITGLATAVLHAQ